MRTGYPVVSTESGQKGLFWRAQEPAVAPGQLSRADANNVTR